MTSPSRQLKSLPFKFRRIFLDSAELMVRLEKVKAAGKSSCSAGWECLPAYVVSSLTPANVEEAKALSNAEIESASRGIQDIASYLYKAQKEGLSPEMVIAVHGYNTPEVGACERYKEIYYHAITDDAIPNQGNQVFVGYRWPSETVWRSHTKSKNPIYNRLLSLWENLNHWKRSIFALPVVPQGLLYGFVGFLVAILLAKPSHFSLPIFSYIAFFFISVIFTLFILRLFMYFRDVYRAINFAVPELTELLRQIEQELVSLHYKDNRVLTKEEIRAIAQVRYDNQKAQGNPRTLESYVEALSAIYEPELSDEEKDEIAGRRLTHSQDCKRVKLSFIGHSMGSLVITNLVRVLSDVFDLNSIRHNPDSCIGRTLKLGRLVLASPDIPVLAVTSNRANRLASSLRRFEEAYLFCNEGDIVLRWASTAVNYISFPSDKQVYGHRLGSISLPNGKDSTGKDYDRGIINFDTLEKFYKPRKENLDTAVREDSDSVLKFLFVTSSLDLIGIGRRLTQPIRIDPTSGYKKGGFVSLWDLFNERELIGGNTKKSARTNSQLLNRTRLDHSNKSAPPTLADLFTFFDCTDYQDVVNPSRTFKKRKQNRGAQKKRLLTTPRLFADSHINFFDYIVLGIASFLGLVNTHGGYFDGKYSCELIYRLAFVGFKQTVEAESRSGTSDRHASLEQKLTAMSENCRDRHIKVYLSPLRYCVDIQEEELDRAKAQMMAAVRLADATPSREVDQT